MASKSLDYTRIAAICKAQGFEPKDVLKKSKLLFDSYKNAKFLQDNIPMKELSDEEVKKQMASARYQFLDLFWRRTEENEEDMRAFINKAITFPWFEKVIEFSLDHLADFKSVGKTYRKIIEVCYFKAIQETDIDRMVKCGLSRSRFYAKREEAIILFGVILWDYTKRREYEEMGKGLIANHPIYPFDSDVYI